MEHKDACIDHKIIKLINEIDAELAKDIVTTNFVFKSKGKNGKL